MKLFVRSIRRSIIRGHGKLTVLACALAACGLWACDSDPTPSTSDPQSDAGPAQAGRAGKAAAGSGGRAGAGGQIAEAGLPDADVENDAGATHSPVDAGDAAPSEGDNDTATGCPFHISVNTRTYGSGDESEDDYAPRNVGAIWITSSTGAFLRTITAWGPGYWDFAYTWVQQSRGNRVDAVSAATRADHERTVEADWDCRDNKQQLVAKGDYRLNSEFTEAEAQGPLLTGDRALTFHVGAKAVELVRAAEGSFGEIRVTPAAAP